MARPSPASLDFLSPLAAVPGLGPKRVAALADSGVETVGDLLYRFPRRHVDRSTITSIADLADFVGQERTIVATVERSRVERGRRSRLRVLVSDSSGSIELLWFHGIPYIRNVVHNGARLVVTGTAGMYKRVQMVHPQCEPLPDGQDMPDTLYVPQYRISVAMKEAGIGQKTMVRAVRWLFDHLKHYPQVLPARIEERKAFPPLEECLVEQHFPSSMQRRDACRDRIVYEELYTLALSLQWSRRTFAQPGRSLDPGDLVGRFQETLPFSLTPQQQQAVDTLLENARAGQRMHRLLQGDVGSGKTVVAFMACLPALASGCQVAWMAPTEVLARQTWQTVKTWLEPLGYDTALLTGAVSDKRSLRADLASGALSMVVGTHALLQPQVSFGRLGMVVIDEQHRFGVKQRLALQKKDERCDFLLMSATPIPQSLAQTFYGDLELVTIEGRPPGRRDVRTHLVPDAKRGDMEQFVREQIADHGAQAYYVVPRIEQGDDEESDLKDLQTTYRHLTRNAFKGVPAALVHGGLPAQDKDAVVSAFRDGGTSLLVATTVVEVGIDAPGATIIVIENAERFGVSALHQLRGRVGRSAAQGYCFLLSPLAEKEPAVRERLAALCRSHDGFELAEMDLRHRGPGQVMGQQQSGWDDRAMAAILNHTALFREIQQELRTAIATDSTQGS